MNPEMFFTSLANGISLGSLYALVAIGYTMVYGILRLINFAHGDLLMIAAYSVFFMNAALFPWWAAAILAVLITGVLGVSIEKMAYRPLRSSPRISVLISAIGVSFFIENLGLVLFSGVPKPFYTPDFFTREVVIAGVSVTSLTFYIIIVTAVMLGLLVYLLKYTKTGMAMRALSVSFDTASLMAINVNRIIAITFAIGSILAAVGGIMWALKYPQIHPLMGILPGLKCFTAAVLGGIGNVTGAVIGGFLLGLVEIMAITFLPALSGYRDAFAFIILIVILLLKPSGIMGKEVTEKV
jgi:branched-chain amino acid transport system permease protein